MKRGHDGDRPAFAIEDGRFAEQKYLDNWPTRFEGVKVLQHKGANLAPWSLPNYEIRQEGGKVWIDGQPLIFFHFHNFKQINCWIYDSGVGRFSAALSPVARRTIYGSYIHCVKETTRRGEQLIPTLANKMDIRWELAQSRRQGSVLLKNARALKDVARTAAKILQGEYILTLHDFVF